MSEESNDLAQLTADEKRALLARLMARQRAAAPAARVAFHRQFEAQAARWPDATALVVEDRAVTYADLNSRANRLARRLRALGASCDQPVALCLARSVELVVAFLAVLKAGAAYLPLDPRLPRVRLALLLAESGARLVAGHGDLAERLADTAAVFVALDESGTTPAGEGAGNLPGGDELAALAYVLFTSGSTGVPKAVAVEHRQLASYVEAAVARLELAECASFAHVSTFAADLGNTMLLPALALGATLHLLREERTTDPAAFAEYFVRHRIDALKIVPSHLEALLAHAAPAQVLPAKRLVLGGESTSWALVERVRALAPGLRVFTHYGPTETAVGVIAGEVPKVGAGAGPVPLGRPLAGSRLYLLGANLQAAPFGVAGELYVGGQQVTRGYLGRPALTAERFVPNPFGKAPGDRLYRTGDLARFCPNQGVEFLGRADHQVKLRGIRIELGEIEAALRGHPAVSAAAVALREDEPGQQRLVAYVVGSEPAGAEELRDFLSARLPEALVPAAYVQLPRLPLNDNGKVDRAALPAPWRGRPEAHRHVAPATPAEKDMAAIWSSALGQPAIGIHDDFLELGGDSILGIQIVARCHQASWKITLRQLFELRTIARLAAAAVPTARSGGAAAAVRLTAEQQTLVERLGRERAIEEAYPLSPMQQGLLFQTLMAPGSGDYISQMGFVLAGKPDLDLYQRAWREVARRHAALRTGFLWRDVDEPLQVVFRDLELPIAVEDWTGVTGADRQRELAAYRRQQLAKGWFQPDRVPPTRVSLLVMGEGVQVSVSYHHMLFDGWSLTLVLREVGEIYEAWRAGREPALAPPRPYSDYILWLQQQDLVEAEAFWRGYLGQMSAPTPLPGDLEPEALPGEQQGYAQTRVRLTAEQTAALRALARERGFTLNTVVLAAWALLLSRLTGERRVVVGNVIAGRPPEIPGVESIVGLFINSVALAVEVRPELAWRSWLDGLHREEVEALQHGFAPLLKVQQWAGLPPGVPLFKSVAAFSFFSEDSWGGQDWEVAQTGYPLNLVVCSGTCLLLALTYGLRHFNAAAVESLARHWRALLESMLARPDAAVGELSTLTAEESEQLARFNGRCAVRPAAPGYDAHFAAQAARTPNAVAVRCGSDVRRYADLAADADRVAAALAASGQGPEAVVPVLAERGVAYLAAVLGAFRAGVAYLPLDPQQPAERLAHVLDESRASCLVVSRPLGALADEAEAVLGRRLVRLDLEALLAAEPAGPVPHGELDSGQLAYVIFTSGSTGVPKGVMVEERGMLNHLVAKVDELDLTAADVVAQNASQGFDVSIWQLLAALLVGGRVEILTGEAALDPRALLEAVAERGVTVLELVPSLLRSLLETLDAAGDAAPEVSGLRILMLTGEALPPDLVRGWMQRFPAVPVVNAYGPTECSDDVTHAFLYQPPAPEATRVPIGRPLRNLGVWVVDREGQLAPVGATGELWVTGAGVGRGYLHDPRRTAELFVPDPFSGVAGARAYRSGDLGRLGAGDELEFLGRLDHQVKLRGYRLELGEVEAALLRQGEVRDAVVVVRQDESGEPFLAAYVVRQAGAPGELAGLRESLRRLLPEYMVPAAWMELPALPLTGTAKIDRRALPAPERGRRACAPAAVESRDPLEQTLVELWQRTLNVPRVGVADNFFELGGHSLLAVRLMASIQKELDIEIPLSSLFRGPTVAQLAAVLRGQDRQELWSPLVEIQPAGWRVPIFAVHPTGGDVLCYYHLSRLLGPDQPFYGLQARGLDGRREPRARVEEMAADYRNALQEVRPEGPYVLAGWSFGGVVAYELARQLTAGGDEVADLVVFDAVAPLAPAGAGEMLSSEGWASWFELLASEVAERLGTPMPVARQDFLGLAPEAQLERFLEVLYETGVVPRETGRGMALAFWRIHEANTRAMWRYSSQAKPYSGRLTLVRTRQGSVLADSRDPTLHASETYGWQRLVQGGIDVIYAPGNHNTLLAPPQVASIATLLAERLAVTATCSVAFPGGASPATAVAPASKADGGRR